MAFEPEPREFERLKNKKPKNVTLSDKALSSHAGTIKLYVTKSEGLSSIYKPNFKILRSIETDQSYSCYAIDKEVEVEAATLDDEVKDGFATADFVKLDTEGSEVDILYGAQGLLDNSIVGVESEISYVQLREQQRTFSDMLHYLHDKNFEIFDVRNRHQKRPIGQKFGKRKGQLIYCDALFFKNIPGLEDIVGQLKCKQAKRDKILNSMILVGGYGYFDYAYEIFEHFKYLFSGPDQKVILESFNQTIIPISKFPHFPGRGFIANIFYQLGVIIGSSEAANRSAFRFGDRTLGNIDWW
jgi:FkbM family methyltransferase